MTKKVAIISQDGCKVTYEDLLSFCGEFSTCLEVGKLIMIRCEICIEVVMVYVAALKNKTPIIMVENNMDCYKLIEEYMPQYIWQNVNETSISGYKKVYDWKEYVLLKREDMIVYEINKELALLLSTSGSTGSTKFVRISYENIEVSTKAIVDSLDITNNSVTMTMLPLSYIYGISIVNTYLFAKATLLIPDSIMIQKRYWDFFNVNGGNSLFGVPYSYEILRKLNIFSKILHNIELVAVSGGKMSEDNIDYMIKMSTEYKFDFAVMYGQTEATGRITSGFINGSSKKKGSSGKVIACGIIEIDNGEIVYYGKNVSMGYAKKYLDLNKGDEFRGVLRTEDVGYIDDEGYLYIEGRRKRISKINGYRISLDELESIVGDKIGRGCVCIERSSTINIIIEGQGKSNTDIELLEWLEDITHLNKKFYTINYTVELPRNINGKIMYEEIYG